MMADKLTKSWFSMEMSEKKIDVSNLKNLYEVFVVVVINKEVNQHQHFLAHIQKKKGGAL